MFIKLRIAKHAKDNHLGTKVYIIKKFNCETKEFLDVVVKQDGSIIWSHRADADQFCQTLNVWPDVFYEVCKLSSSRKTLKARKPQIPWLVCALESVKSKATNSEGN
jgi:hypothetical protein